MKHYWKIVFSSLFLFFVVFVLSAENSAVTAVSGRGSFFQIGTQTDLVKIGAFPDSSFTSSSPALSNEKQNLFMSAIGGHALLGDGVNSAFTNFHQLFVDPIEFYNIDIKDLRDGFTLIFS